MSSLSVNRRRFGGMLAAAVGAASAPALAAAAPQPRMHTYPLIKPARLRQGDLVALVAPAGLLDEDEIAKAIGNMESLGLRVSLGTHIRAANGN